MEDAKDFVTKTLLFGVICNYKGAIKMFKNTSICSIFLFKDTLPMGK